MLLFSTQQVSQYQLPNFISISLALVNPKLTTMTALGQPGLGKLGLAKHEKFTELQMENIEKKIIHI